MSIEYFFATPLIVNDVDAPLRETIQNKVAAFLESQRAKETLAPAPEESVVTSYYRQDASILVDANLEELEALVLSTAKAYLERTLKLPPRRIEVEHAWINLFEPGAQEMQHTHDGSLLSCSYYVEAPQDCGCIVFPDPITARRSYREFTKTTNQELTTRPEIAVEPQPGRFVMFESWTPHYVQCNKSDQVRISIAINLRVAPEQQPAVALAGQSASAPADSVVAATASVGREHAPSSSASQTGMKDGQPFLFNDLFQVNQKLNVVVEPLDVDIPVVVVDDFLADPERVREVIGSTPATNWKHEPGGRNFQDYYDCRLRFPIRHPNQVISATQRIIQQVFGVKTRPADPSVDVNWFRQINAKRANFAVPHADITEQSTRSITCVTYLNREAECSGGTAFFRFKRSNSLFFNDVYARTVAADSSIAETGLDYWPQATLDEWEQVASIEMKPGRMLVFPSQYFHAAFHPENSFFDFPRLTLAFWMLG